MPLAAPVGFRNPQEQAMGTDTRKFTWSALALGLTLALGSSAQTPSTSSSTSTTGSKAGTSASASAKATSKGASKADQSFVEKAAMGGMAEVELGNLAQEKASNPEVKAFGSRMVQDHSKANDELKQIASSKGMQLPTALDKKHRSDIDRLSKMSGAQFDRAYMSHMVDDHREDVADFKKQANSGQDTDLKGFASKTLPTLQEHLQLAQKTNLEVKKAGSSSVVGSGAAGTKSK
jgi:putative membrane protein